MRIPTKDLSLLKNLHIVILVQNPVLSAELVTTQTEQGAVISAAEVRQKLGIQGKILDTHMKRAPDMISFKTDYIGEIPLFDMVEQSVVQNIVKTDLRLKKFQARGFDIKAENPCTKLQDEPNVCLSYGIDVMSMYHTHEKALNSIITTYDKDSNPSDADIAYILQQTKEIQPRVLMNHAERLLGILMNIFCKTQSPAGSSYIFEAILYVIRFFKSQKSAKERTVVDDFITRRH